MKKLNFIDARPLANKILKETEIKLQNLRKLKLQQNDLNVTTVHFGPAQPYHFAAERYAARIAGKLGIEWKNRTLKPDITLGEVFGVVASMNLDPQIHGIIMARPTPPHLKMKELHESLHPLKDVEGMHPSNIGLVVYGGSTEIMSKILLPCTATAAVEMLRYSLTSTSTNENNCSSSTKDVLQGIEALVVGNSDILAKPVCSLLHAAGATVSVIPEDSPKLAAYAKASDVVFLAASNRPSFVFYGDMLSPGTTLIDIGFNVVSHSTLKNEKNNNQNNSNKNTSSNHVVIQGDADLESCIGIVKNVSTIANGIGLVRTAILFKNIVEGWAKQHQHLINKSI